MRRLLGLKNLIHDAIEKTTTLVEETHETVVGRQVQLLTAVAGADETVNAVNAARRFTTALVYETIRATNHGVRLLGDAGIALAAEAADELAARDATDTALRAVGSRIGASTLAKLAVAVDSAQGALNGAVGDFLRDQENELGIRMAFRSYGEELPLDPERLRRDLGGLTEKVCIFVHGLGCTEHAWEFLSEQLHGDPGISFGKLLQAQHGYTPLWVRYNTGLHVSENGRALSQLVRDLLAAYPGEIREIVLVGHSMGGLVVRSASHYGRVHGEPWVQRLTHVFCIGSPHLGAPLEKGAGLLAAALRWFPSAGTEVPARVMNARSAGIKDLRFGYVLDEDWAGQDPNALRDNRHDAPLVEWAVYCYIASSLTRDPEHPLSVLLGDVLVRIPSASGRAPEPERHIPFHVGTVIGGAHHLETMNHPDVYAQIVRWLTEARPVVPELG